jgi:hypothetical protein
LFCCCFCFLLPCYIHYHASLFLSLVAFVPCYSRALLHLVVVPCSCHVVPCYSCTLLLALSCHITYISLLLMLFFMFTPYYTAIVAIPSHLAACLFQVPVGTPPLLLHYLATHYCALLLCFINRYSLLTFLCK